MGNQKSVPRSVSYVRENTKEKKEKSTSKKKWGSIPDGRNGENRNEADVEDFFDIESKRAQSSSSAPLGIRPSPGRVSQRTSATSGTSVATSNSTSVETSRNMDTISKSPMRSSTKTSVVRTGSRGSSQSGHGSSSRSPLPPKAQQHLTNLERTHSQDTRRLTSDGSKDGLVVRENTAHATNDIQPSPLLALQAMSISHSVSTHNVTSESSSCVTVLRSCGYPAQNTLHIGIGGNVKASNSFRRTKSVRESSSRMQRGGGKNAATTSQLKLQPAQIHLVRKSWHTARTKGALEPGMTIFRNAFLKSPTMREVFSCNDKSHEMLKEHAMVFTELMDDLIANLENETVMIDALKDVGRKHCRLDGNCPSLFKPAHIDVFANSMIERTLEWGEKASRNSVSQTAWTKIVLFFTEMIKDGYYEETRMVKRVLRRKNSGKTKTAPSVTLTDTHGQQCSADVTIR